MRCSDPACSQCNPQPAQDNLERFRPYGVTDSEWLLAVDNLRDAIHEFQRACLVSFEDLLFAIQSLANRSRISAVSVDELRAELEQIEKCKPYQDEVEQTEWQFGWIDWLQLMKLEKLTAAAQPAGQPVPRARPPPTHSRQAADSGGLSSPHFWSSSEPVRAHFYPFCLS